MLVALEGLDNSGKTTIIDRLKGDFTKQKHEIICIKELESPVGDLI